MCNTRKLRGKMVEQGYTQEALSNAMGIDKSTLNRKLKTGEFTVGEVNKIVEILKIATDEAIQIFLPILSQKCE